MPRKRIKTLAHEWNVPVEDVIHSAERLKLSHARLDSSLLTTEEADRVKADLDEQANRAAMLRHEVVLETTAGKVVEKRLNEGIMRRRHAEPEPTAAIEPTQSPAGEPFVFEAEPERQDDFIAPFLEAQPAPEPEVPIILETERFEPEPQPQPEPKPSIESVPQAEAEPHLADGHDRASAVSASVSAVATPQAPTEPPGEVSPAPTPPSLSVQEPPPFPATTTSSNEVKTRPVYEQRRHVAPGLSRESKTTVVERPQGAASVAAKEAARPTRPAGAPGVINLARGHASAPSLDDQQQGPKVLGKIDLRKSAARPTSATPARPTGTLARPG